MKYEYRIIINYRPSTFLNKENPYRWHIEYAEEFGVNWKEIFNGWSKNPEECFKDANIALELVKKDMQRYIRELNSKKVYEI